MNWFRQNRFLGIFAIATAVATIAAVTLLLIARGSWNDEGERWQRDVAEFDRLQGLAPFPSGENLRKVKAHAEDYAASVAKLKEELKTRVLPAPPLAPNEFQARLRAAVTSIAEQARGVKAKLPENFFLGFDLFAAALPNTAAAPLLGQQLTQVETLMRILLDAHVDAVTMLRRSPLPEENGAAPAPVAGKSGPKIPGTSPAVGKLVERSTLEVSFTSTPAAARRVLNSVATADHQFFIVRLLQVRNEKEKGPVRELAPDPNTPAAGAAAAATPPPGKAPAALNFIVGNEHIQTTAKIEIVRFNF